MNKPLFSIIVPAYNSGKVIGDLLQSIVNQGMDKSAIEVIISDDCSTKPYNDVVDRFKDKLLIKQVSTDYNYCPGNTRQRGAENATGEWMLFCDADDVLAPKTLPKIADEIAIHPDVRYIITPFYEINPFTNEITRKIDGATGWTHGKIYNKPRLWDAEKLYFKKDLKSHEDVYMTSLVSGIICGGEDEDILLLSLPFYYWRCWPRSQSKSSYTGTDGKQHDFLQVFFRDYLEATGYVYLDLYKHNRISRDFAISNCIGVIGYSYFYCQGFIYHEPKTYMKEDIRHARRFYRKATRMLQITKKDIYQFFTTEQCKQWVDVKRMSRIATGEMVEPYSFPQWLNLMEEEQR